MKKVIAYVHSHWDREWYREFEEFRLRLIEVFDEVLSELETGNLSCFYFDGQTAALEDYLEIRSGNSNKVKELIAQKKLHIGPFYCSADSFLVSGESLCRNLEIGIKKAKEFGESDFIGYLADTFGHSRAIPYILKSFGINKACLWRGLGDLPADLNWDGINVTYLIQGYFQDFLNTEVPMYKKAASLKKYLEKIALKSSDTVLLPIGADHLAAAKNLSKKIDELNKIYQNEYEIKLSSPFEYFAGINERKNVEGEFLNNKLNFILPGVYSSRMYVKQANAHSQWLLSRIAEPMQALGHFCFGTKNKQSEIDYAYKLLIKNHAHDSIYGCSIDEVHRQVMDRYHRVETVSNGIIKRVQRDLAGSHLSVINLSEFRFSGVVKITTDKEPPDYLNAVKIASYKGFTDEKLYNINDIPITEDMTQINDYLIDVENLEPFSITKITKENICSKNYLKYTENSLENKYIKFEINSGEIILTDKINQKKYVNFISFKDRADIGDSYNFGALKNDIPVFASLKKYGLKEQNSIRIIFNLHYEIDIPLNSDKNGRTAKYFKHDLNIDVILCNQSKYLEFELNWVNKSKNHILQIDFNLKEKIISTLNEDLFGTTERKFNPDYDVYSEIPAQRGIELKPNTSPVQRFVSTQNFALFSKGNSEYEINKNILSLTLVRASGIISNPENPLRGTPAGPPLLTPELQCCGNNSANFAIAFTGEDKELFRLADEFYSPCCFVFTDKEDKKLIEISNNNLLVYAIRLCGENLGMRLFNNSDCVQKTYINNDYGKEYVFKPHEIRMVYI